MERPDLSEFDELTARKASWSERLNAIDRHFPSVSRLDWGKAFTADPGMASRLINDILKIGEITPGKAGKRPSLVSETPTLAERQDVHAKVRQLTGSDYATEPFPEAFRALARERSVRHLASKTGLDRNMIQKIRGGYTPPLWVMEKIAAGFKKTPEYFAEYRVAYLLGVLNEHLDRNPEASMLFFRRVRDGAKSR